MKQQEKQDEMTTEEVESEVKPEDARITDENPAASEAERQDVEVALAAADEKYLRLAAEFENFKKRSARERMDLISSANDNILLQMLDSVDNFERALDSATNSGSNDNPQKLYESLREGAKMIHQQLLGILRAHGVEEIEAKGVQFDPALHEAVVQVETEEHAEDHIAQVMSKGYKRGERVLRHSKVGVAAKKKSQD